MEHVDGSSNKSVWIVVAVVGVFLVVFGAAVVLFAQLGTLGTSDDGLKSTKTVDSETVSSDDVKNSLLDIDSSLSEATASQGAVQEALNDDKNRVKLGN